MLLRIGRDQYGSIRAPLRGLGPGRPGTLSHFARQLPHLPPNSHSGGPPSRSIRDRYGWQQRDRSDMVSVFNGPPPTVHSLSRTACRATARIACPSMFAWTGPSASSTNMANGSAGVGDRRDRFILGERWFARRIETAARSVWLDRATSKGWCSTVCARSSRLVWKSVTPSRRSALKPRPNKPCLTDRQSWRSAGPSLHHSSFANACGPADPDWRRPNLGVAQSNRDRVERDARRASQANRFWRTFRLSITASLRRAGKCCLPVEEGRLFAGV